MTRRTRTNRVQWVLVVLVLLVVAGAAAVWWFNRQQAPAPVVREAPAPAVQTKTTGNYSQDWMDSCAPLTGQAQAACTARLDAAYGKTDASPVPPPKGR